MPRDRPRRYPLRGSISAWNDFLWPLIAVNKPETFPLPVTLAPLGSACSSGSYGFIMAGAPLSALPLLVVFLVVNRRIVEERSSERRQGLVGPASPRVE